MTQTNSFNGLNILTWLIQIAVAGLFIMAGAIKLTQPLAEVSANIPWAADVPSIFVRIIGLVDLIGGLGLLLPSVLRIQPHYAYCAAWSLCFVMLLAVVFHLIRGEFAAIAVNLILLALLYFIGWARYKKVPIGIS